MDFDFLRVYKLDELGRDRLDRLKNKITPEIEGTVKKILADIRERGKEAVLEYAHRYDDYKSPDFQALRVGLRELEDAYNNTKKQFPELVQAIEACIKNITVYHQEQLKRESGSWFVRPIKGKKIGQLVTPIERVGIYVPGGRYPYPSSLLMTAIPAGLAGVREVAVCSPQQKGGQATQVFLYVCRRLGIKEVYNLGGAQAVGLLAYGAAEIRGVDKIVGPGNIYVTAAKKEVFGTVGIDSLAGPSEIVVAADETADKNYIAADLISQAEHDPDAAAMLLTSSKELAEGVADSIREQMQSLETRHKNNAQAAYQALKNNCFIALGGHMAEIMDAVNEIAPEHLEIICRKPEQVLKMVKNAGAVFVGEYTPVALGDYIGGTNHVIPTAGNARFASPLGVYDFLKKSSVLFYSKKMLAKEKRYVQQFSAFENLHAHKRSISIRFGDNKDED
ncbi:MAG: histidinol dehydrogenase [Actinomycetota bacterium]